MLIEFKYQNFKSFKESTSFLMTTVKSFSEHEENNLIKTSKDFDLLKTSAVYGINGGGKSNFIAAMSYMTGIIHDSFNISLKKDEDKPDHNFQFKLSTETENAPTSFEATFLIDNYIYRYGFKILNFKIIEEWLYRKIERENYLFIRKGNKFDINKSAFQEGNKYKSEVNDNVLFISHLSQYNQKTSKIVFNWFSKINAISGLTDRSYEKFTTKLLEQDKNFKNWISLVLKYLEISNIEAGEENGEIVTYHNKYDENNLLIGSVPFNVSQESAGTRKLINLLGPIYDTLRLGRILFVDEFDSKLHPNLSIKLVQLFNKFNKSGAQLVFTGHDTIFLNKELFRRDQIWFIDKNQFGISELYPMSDFDAKTVRKDSAYNKKYLDNKFGASHTIEISKQLTDLLYEQ